MNTLLLNSVKPFWDPEIMSLINGIKALIPSSASVSTAKQIAAILSLIYFGYRAYMMLAGEGKFEVTKMLRPFIISLAIINFNTIVDIVALPGKLASSTSEANFKVKAKRVDMLYTTKDSLNNQLFRTLMENTNEIKKGLDVESGTDKSWTDYISAPVTSVTQDLVAYITIYEQLLWLKVSLWLQGIITWIVIGIFKGVCYCIFFIQMILMYILSTLGPFSFAFSVGGPYKDSWSNWIAKYIAVSFYSMIGFTVLYISFTIMEYGFEQEISRLTQVLNKKDLKDQFIATVSNIDNYVGYLWIALVTAVSGVLAIPVASSWIIGTVGTGSAFFGGAANAARGVVGAGAAAASSGAGAVAGAGSKAIKAGKGAWGK